MSAPPGLPRAVRDQIDRRLVGIPGRELRDAARRLSDRYRSDDGGAGALGDDRLAVPAYLASRLPATFAAVTDAMRHLADTSGAWHPSSLLDLGAGPGTAALAAATVWPDLARCTLVEDDAGMVAAGRDLLDATGHPALRRATWHAAPLARGGPQPDLARSDLVTLTYVIGELGPDEAARLLDRAWAGTVGALLVVEPGTPAGHRRVLEARSRLLAAGAHVAAPCPHDLPCPLTPPDWCHFSIRLPRTRLHRQTKAAEAPFEDERYAYLAVTPELPLDSPPRVIRPPRVSKGQVDVVLCTGRGLVEHRTVNRRQRTAYDEARALRWGHSAAPAAPNDERSAP